MILRKIRVHIVDPAAGCLVQLVEIHWVPVGRVSEVVVDVSVAFVVFDP